MAIQYVGGLDGGRVGSTSTTNVSINGTLTGGLASSPSEGDLVVILISAASASGYVPTTLAVSGWNNGTFRSNTGVANYSYQQHSWKFMTATPDTVITVPSTGNIRNAQSWVVHVFRGVDATTPFDVATVFASGTGTGRPNPGPITPSTEGAWILWMGASAAATGALYTAPTNFSTNWHTDTRVDNYDSMVGFGYYTGWSSGQYDPAAITAGGTTGATDSWVAETVVLRPSAAQSFNETPSDTVNVSEVLVKSIATATTELVSFSETVTFQLFKNINETVNISEIVTDDWPDIPITVTRYVNPGSTGGDGTTNALSGTNAAYASLSAWNTARARNLVSANEIEEVICETNGAADTGPVYVDLVSGWIADATRYIIIKAGVGHRASTQWSDSKYRLVANGLNSALVGDVPYTRISGLQFRNLNAEGEIVNFAHTFVYMDGLYCKGAGSSSGGGANGCTAGGIAWNLIVEGSGNNGIGKGNSNRSVYNCTAINCFRGFYDSDNGYRMTVINCLAFNCGTDFNAQWAFPPACSNNASEDGTAPGTNSRTNQTFTFVSSTDYALTNTDTGGHTYGELYPAGDLFNTDINGNYRDGWWDIGASEIEELLPKLSLYWSCASFSIGANDHIIAPIDYYAETTNTPTVGASGAIIGSSGFYFNDSEDRVSLRDSFTLQSRESSLGFWFNASVSGSPFWSQGSSWTDNITIQINIITGVVSVTFKDGTDDWSRVQTPENTIAANTDYFLIFRWKARTNERILEIYNSSFIQIESVSSTTPWVLPELLAYRFVLGPSGSSFQGKLDNVFASKNFAAPIQSYAFIDNYSAYILSAGSQGNFLIFMIG